MLVFVMVLITRAAENSWFYFSPCSFFPSHVCLWVQAKNLTLCFLNWEKNRDKKSSKKNKLKHSLEYKHS